jgi:hypothetical protein
VFSEVPEPLRAYTRRDVDGKKQKWQSPKWAKAFASRLEVFEEVSAHFEKAGGIRRQYIHDYAAVHDDDPVALFLLAMAWGFAEVNYGPFRTAAILAQEDAEYKISHIVNEARTNGARAGWAALLGSGSIKGLNMSFGTKLLYFAGYQGSGCPSPRPLILDDRVRWSLYDLKRGTVPPPGSTSRVKEMDYLRYLDLAETWAADPAWRQESDVVEFGLFDLNGRYRTPVVIPPQR